MAASYVLNTYLYPDFIFFACGKCAGMPVDKWLNADSKVWQTFEVRYWAAKKFGERDTRVVSLLSRSQAAPQHSS